MSVITRGARNAFRNQVRTLSIVLILSLSIGLALSMLIARGAVNKKIESVKSTVGNTVTISPAGVRGFEGGGNPLTQDQVSKVSSLPHVQSINESLNDRLTSSDTNLQSSISAGELGQRFARRSGFGGGSGSSTLNLSNFTPPITVIGSSDPSNLANTQGGGTFTLKSGKVIDGSSSDNIAMLGADLAAKNNLNVGSTFTAYSTTITVVGIFDSGNTFSNSIVVMPLKTVQTLSSQPGDVTSAVVTVDSITNVGSVTSAIENSLGSSADVTNSQDQAAQAIAPLENIKTISLYSLVGAVVAGAVIVLLTMIMIVRERRREIGVVKAIGASNAKVVAQFMSEAVTLTLLAAVVGTVIGFLAASPITKLLVNNSTSSTATGVAAGTGARVVRGFGGLRNNLSDVHATVGWTIMLYGLGAALVIAIAGSASAAWLIAKVRPAEVMRTE